DGRDCCPPCPVGDRPIPLVEQVVLNDHRVTRVPQENAPAFLTALPASEQPGDDAAENQPQHRAGPVPTQLFQDAGRHCTTLASPAESDPYPTGLTRPVNFATGE